MSRWRESSGASFSGSQMTPPALSMLREALRELAEVAEVLHGRVAPDVALQDERRPVDAAEHHVSRRRCARCSRGCVPARRTSRGALATCSRIQLGVELHVVAPRRSGRPGTEELERLGRRGTRCRSRTDDAAPAAPRAPSIASSERISYRGIVLTEHAPSRKATGARAPLDFDAAFGRDLNYHDPRNSVFHSHETYFQHVIKPADGSDHGGADRHPGGRPREPRCSSIVVEATDPQTFGELVEAARAPQEHHLAAAATRSSASRLLRARPATDRSFRPGQVLDLRFARRGSSTARPRSSSPSLSLASGSACAPSETINLSRSPVDPTRSSRSRRSTAATCWAPRTGWASDRSPSHCSALGKVLPTRTTSLHAAQAGNGSSALHRPHADHVDGGPAAARSRPGAAAAGTRWRSEELEPGLVALAAPVRDVDGTGGRRALGVRAGQSASPPNRGSPSSVATVLDRRGPRTCPPCSGSSPPSGK